ncbi:MAG: cell envelope integrity protein CreD [Deferribacteraceae bacterium]|jgi:inner membrane protein|nr:cell envelope integrity protein CreD [Deferribacteraceae bacterium]
MKLLVKIGCIILIILFLLIPLFSVSGISDERQRYRSQVISEIYNSFGKPQILVAPVINADCIQIVKYFKDKEVDFKETPYKITVVPLFTEISADMHVESKNRRIYSSAVYSTTFNIKGVFNVPADIFDEQDNQSVLIRKTYISISITDPKGIKGIPEGKIGSKPLVFDISSEKYNTYTLNAPVSIAEITGRETPFEIKLPMNGTKSLSIVPTGLESKTMLTGNWPHPGFSGAFLPESREVSDAGFSATWVSTWISGHIYNKMVNLHQAQQEDYQHYSFNLDFVNLVDIYSLVNRSVKYGFLIISLTFLVIFVSEMLTKCRIHLVQYGLVGTALVLFFLLLLSLSEQIPFGAAYLTAAAACVSLITFYIYFSLKRIGSTALFSVSLTSLYFVLYILLNVSDYALLIGSGLIFIIIAAVMIATRNFNWYEVSQ